MTLRDTEIAPLSDTCTLCITKEAYWIHLHVYLFVWVHVHLSIDLTVMHIYNCFFWLSCQLQHVGYNNDLLIAVQMIYMFLIWNNRNKSLSFAPSLLVCEYLSSWTLSVIIQISYSLRKTVVSCHQALSSKGVYNLRWFWYYMTVCGIFRYNTRYFLFLLCI